MLSAATTPQTTTRRSSSTTATTATTTQSTTTSTVPTTTATTKVDTTMTPVQIITTPNPTPPIEKVAFSVGLTHNVDLGFIQTIIYDRIYMNIGNGYNIAVGSFVVPKTGIYVLSYTALNIKGSDAYIEIVHNGVRMAITNLDSSGNNMGSQTIIAHLTEGDNVWIRNASSAGPKLMGRAQETYNRFSGFLLLDY